MDRNVWKWSDFSRLFGSPICQLYPHFCVFCDNTTCTLGWSAKKKKNIPRILTKFGGVVGSLSETTQKKFELPRWRRRIAGGFQRAHFEKNMFFFQLVKMACDLWNSAIKAQFEFLHLSEPPPVFSD